MKHTHTHTQGPPPKKVTGIVCLKTSLECYITSLNYANEGHIMNRTAAETNFHLQKQGRKGFHQTPNIITAHTPGRPPGLPALCHWPWF